MTVGECQACQRSKPCPVRWGGVGGMCNLEMPGQPKEEVAGRSLCLI